nr:nuclear pore complex protein NUP133 [Ipomoea batatas]
MFSPGTRKSNLTARKPGRERPLTDSPVTPLLENRRSHLDNAVPNRPSTGTPAPWASRLSVLARIPPTKRSDKGDDTDLVKPVFVGEFPQVLRDQQAVVLQNYAPGSASMSGGMDKETFLAWIISGSKLFIWSYLASAASRNCVVLELPSTFSGNDNVGKQSYSSDNWLVSVVSWDNMQHTNKVVQRCSSAGVIACNQRSRTLVYWPDIFSESRTSPVISYADPEEVELTFSPVDGKATPNKMWQRNKLGSSSTLNSINSLIASAIPENCQHHACIALACSSSGELWQFLCSPAGICRKRIYQNISRGDDGGHFVGGRGYPRSLVWHFLSHSSGKPKRQFLLLTDHEIQCFSIELSPDHIVSKIWSHEIISSDSDLGIQKDLAGQKRIWPLDLQIDNEGKVITILIAIFCKDRITSSSYTEYSLLTMQYKSGVDVYSESVQSTNERILEKQAPPQVIIPKARVEDEDFLFSMRLKIGGKPAGSVIILSGDGTATVSHYWGNSTRLYQFDLPYDAGKVIDASVFPSDDDGEGAWAVLTEKAGVWAIPERAVKLGAVEPPERSLSRKGSSNERSSQEEKKSLSFAGNIAPRRASSEAWDAGDRQRSSLSGIARRTAQDEESEALLNQLFHDFLSSGQVDGAFDKLKHSGAFERDGDTNVFVRTSKSIVDTLAKHWTTTRGAEIVALSVVTTQLIEKEQKHQQFLQFLALSKCHEELCYKQRHSLQIIMEHGEKLAAMIQLRELQSTISQNRGTGFGSYLHSDMQVAGALWDLIQLVGERARRRTVLLMDRDNAEVFYSKVSDLEELFHCLERQLEYIVSEEMTFSVQIQRACELSNACVILTRAAMKYRNEQHLWYPSTEGLMPWNSQEKIRNGLWSIASLMLQLSKQKYPVDDAMKLSFYSHLEKLSDILLEAYSGAITARIECGEGHKGLLDEYWSRRDALLNSLYQQVKDFVEGKNQDSVEEFKQEQEETFRKLSLGLFSIAKRHEGYQTLWNICSDLSDLNLLRTLMHESMGPTGGFSYFVFQQLYDNKQWSKLMRLGEEFQEELAIFLKQHQDLLWLHEVFLHQFSSATETLHVLALSQDDRSISDMDTFSYATNKRTSLSDRKRFLNLSKIAAMAGKDANFETKLKRVDADLRILNLQEIILELLPDDEMQNIGQRQLLPPMDLIELCLKSQSRELSLRAFDVFAWTSFSFLKSNTSLLEECWRNASNQDDWEKLYQASVAEGWSDEETLSILQDTILFQASSRCYGPNAMTFEGSFNEVLPLRHESSELQNLKGTASSMETILMQHKDFPDAGKLMLTAIMLGSVQGDAIMEEPSPME